MEAVAAKATAVIHYRVWVDDMDVLCLECGMVERGRTYMQVNGHSACPDCGAEGLATRVDTQDLFEQAVKERRK